jgi:signal transduction histidine kinase
VHLESLVTQRTARLTEMVNELQHVSYAIVHDMRAPLRAMNTFARDILDELTTFPQSAHLQDECRRIISAASRLDKLIQDTLNYTKAVLNEVPLQPVDLSVLIPSLIEIYPNLHPKRADITIANTLPTVLGEESLLTQCFSNLLGNAVKFVAEGVRPKILIRSQAATAGAGNAQPGQASGPSGSPIPAPCQSNGDFVRIVVEDNGIGIPPIAQRRLFGMFERLTSGYEGTGIGLAIVRKVAERMGGRVGAESEPGKGSRFWVELRTPRLLSQSKPG